MLSSGGMGFNPYDPNSNTGSSRVNQVGQMGDRVVAAYHGVTSRIGSGNNNDLEVGAGEHEGIGDSAGAAISALGEPSGLAGLATNSFSANSAKQRKSLICLEG